MKFYIKSSLGGSIYRIKHAKLVSLEAKEMGH